MLTLKLVATLAFACACMAQSAVKQNGQVLQPSQYRFMKMVFNRRLNVCMSYNYGFHQLHLFCSVKKPL